MDKIEKKPFCLTQNTKVYVYCPGALCTGGTELLHQLVDTLNAFGREAYIVYIGEKITPKDFACYNIKIADCIEDNAENIVIIIESAVAKIFDIKNAQICLWWLSVDNYFFAQKENIPFTELFGFSKSLFFNVLSNYKLIDLALRYPFFLLKKLQILRTKNLVNYPLLKCNAYQSEYAKDFLQKFNATNAYPLKDFINDDYKFDKTCIAQKQNIIAYNPKKGYAFTKKLIKKAPDLQWVPIINMSRQQVIELLKKSKVYIDFGHHPGKDRIPREAALNGCCVITSLHGAAKFYKDIPIDENLYKFKDSTKSIPQIIKRIKSILQNYEEELCNFDAYRDAICKEKDEFLTQVKELFICD